MAVPAILIKLGPKLPKILSIICCIALVITGFINYFSACAVPEVDDTAPAPASWNYEPGFNIGIQFKKLDVNNEDYHDPGITANFSLFIIFTCCFVCCLGISFIVERTLKLRAAAKEGKAALAKEVGEMALEEAADDDDEGGTNIFQVCLVCCCCGIIFTGLTNFLIACRVPDTGRWNYAQGSDNENYQRDKVTIGSGKNDLLNTANLSFFIVATVCFFCCLICTISYETISETAAIGEMALEAGEAALDAE